jgi:hypothetical protein
MEGGIFEINWGALLTSFKLKTVLEDVFFGSETLSAQETFLEGIFGKYYVEFGTPKSDQFLKCRLD